MLQTNKLLFVNIIIIDYILIIIIIILLIKINCYYMSISVFCYYYN